MIGAVWGTGAVLTGFESRGFTVRKLKDQKKTWEQS
jgi:hypothetical protein